MFVVLPRFYGGVFPHLMGLALHAGLSEDVYDHRLNKASGVRVMHAHTRAITEYHARIIFLNASTIASAALLDRKSVV